MNFRYSDLGQWPVSILSNSKFKMFSLLNERVSTEEQSAQFNPPISNRVTTDLNGRLHSQPILRGPICLACSIETFNSLVRFIQGSRWYGRFNFANSISFLST